MLSNILSIGKNFSGTEGLGNIETISLLRKVNNNFTGITNIEELKNKLPEICKNRTEKQIKADTKSLFKFLESVREIFQVKDPIFFLYNLYFGENFELGLKDILKRLNENGIQISYVCLYKYFTKFFKWELADKGRQKKKKNKAKSIPGGHGGLGTINLKRKKSIEKETSKLISLIEETKGKIDNIVFNNIETYYKVDKITYILYTYGLLKNNSRKDFKLFLKKLKNKKGLGERKIAKIINNIIKHFSYELIEDLEISQKNIINWLK